MRNVRSFIIKFLLVALCLFCIVQSDQFQAFYSPKKYWNKRSDDLSAQLKSDESKMKILQLSLEREKTLLKHDLSHAKDLAMAIGQEETQVREKMVLEGNRRISVIENEMQKIQLAKRQKSQSLKEAIDHKREAEEAFLWYWPSNKQDVPRQKL